MEIGIGNPSVKFFMNGEPLEENSTQINRGTGTYTVSIDSEITYLQIIWYLNGNIVAQGESRTSIILSKQTAGTFHITVEATPAGGMKDSGSHSFVVQ